MFIVTARIPKRRLISAGIGLLCCCVAAIAGIICATRMTTASAAGEVKGIRSETDQVAYLESLGWAVSEAPVAVEQLLVPEEFDASYDEYLALQSAQGFDLMPYRGKQIARYTYQITNYPGGETGIHVSLLVYKNKIIGGEVFSPTADGFLHGIAMPGTQSGSGA